MNQAENLTLWPVTQFPAKQVYKTDKDQINQSFLDDESKRNLIKNIPSPELKDEIITFLPFSDLHISHQEGSTIYEGARILDIKKLTGVHSLSHLSYRLTDLSGEAPVTFLDLYENRFNHVLVVAMTAEAIARNNGLPEEDVKRLSIAALLHDRATPAMGDATKKVDMDALHEEDFWWEDLSEEAWDFIHKNGADKQMIDDIIHNKGLLGEILDIADKISYVMLDLQQTGFTTYGNRGNIYKNVGIDQVSGIPYFTDVTELDIFLETRALLFNRVYASDYSQATDFVFETLLARFYSRTPEDGKLTPQQLRNMTDDKLLEFLAEKIGMQTPFWLERSKVWYPEVKQFATLEEAQDALEQLQKNPKYLCLGIKKGQGFNPGSHFLVLDDEEYKGETVTFRESRPFQTRILENYAELAAGYFVVYYDNPDEEIKKIFD